MNYDLKKIKMDKNGSQSVSPNNNNSCNDVKPRKSRLWPGGSDSDPGPATAAPALAGRNNHEIVEEEELIEEVRGTHGLGSMNVSGLNFSEPFCKSMNLIYMQFTSIK